MRDLMGLLPDFYANSPEMAKLQRALSLPLSELWEAWNDFQEQLNPATATWGLAAWEEALGLTADGRSLTARRAAVTGRLRGRGTTTVEIVRSVCESFVSGSVEVEEFPQAYTVVIRILQRMERELDIAGLHAALREIMPAHLAFGYAVSFESLAETAARAGGKMAAAVFLPIPEAADAPEFRESLRTGGRFTARTALPVPERADGLALCDTFRAGGRGAIRSTLVPANDTRDGKDKNQEARTV